MDGLPPEVLSHVMAYATSDYRDRMTLLYLRLVSRAIHELVATNSSLSIHKMETRFFGHIAGAIQTEGGHAIQPTLAIGDDGHALSVACYPTPDATRPGRHTLARFAKSGGWYCITRTDNLLTNKDGDSQRYVRLELHTKGVNDKNEPVPSLMKWSRRSDHTGTAFEPMQYAEGVSAWSCTTSRGLVLSVKNEHLVVEPVEGVEASRLIFDRHYWITSKVTSSMQTLCSYISVAAYYHFDYEVLGKTPNPGDMARQDVIAELTSLCQSLGDDAYHSRGWYGADIVYASPLELEHAPGLTKRVPPLCTKIERKDENEKKDKNKH